MDSYKEKYFEKIFNIVATTVLETQIEFNRIEKNGSLSEIDQMLGAKIALESLQNDLLSLEKQYNFESPNSKAEEELEDDFSFGPSM